MLRIVKSLITIAAVLAVAGGVTSAYFSDTETSVGNSFTAGTLDLKVGGQDDPNVAHVTVTNITPAAHMTTQRGQGFTLTNAGSVGGTVTATVKNVVNYENGCLEPEVAAGDTTCGATEGELGGLMVHTQWLLNQSPWGGIGLAFASLNASANVPVTDVKFHLNPGESKQYYFQNYFDTSPSDNLAQSDGVSYDVEFVLNQD
jgi:predicted ribosomally synthesized peptide with SipW-like signal peptide